ncbi:hypothetical protein PAXRUDRAFT_21232 [Paxillus rubicundulus Ve08.2h10]|uniref:Uncharacterized protein n=1 Tax=Paxillus rubicundulus Ve08.2h10 TaxID=930991 RepID=A0A0D0CC87_9AGAM|nr:hypothetical protein PAXRUDRAFT_21232 [Paxillus rubicundulus Ve08.2h10]
MRSIISAHVFTTSQSAQAHLILFHHIFQIAAKDTGNFIKFCHIHGSGIESVIADGHQGQALVDALR